MIDFKFPHHLCYDWNCVRVCDTELTETEPMGWKQPSSKFHDRNEPYGHIYVDELTFEWVCILCTRSDPLKFFFFRISML